MASRIHVGSLALQRLERTLALMADFIPNDCGVALLRAAEPGADRFLALADNPIGITTVLGGANRRGLGRRGGGRRVGGGLRRSGGRGEQKGGGDGREMGWSHEIHLFKRYGIIADYALRRKRR